MSEARELFERFSQKLWNRMIAANKSGDTALGGVLCEVGAALDDALKGATQPDADPVPELPPHLEGPDRHGDYWMTTPDGARHRIRPVPGYEGYAARMAEAWAIIEARERARRAGS